MECSNVTPPKKTIYPGGISNAPRYIKGTATSDVQPRIPITPPACGQGGPIHSIVVWTFLISFVYHHLPLWER